MPPYVDPNYRIDVYLDTNILVDYIEHTYPSLNYSLDYLAQTGYITLRTSQYVLYEFAEVRKYNLFYSLLPIKEEDREKSRGQLKFQIKQNNWKYNGIEYTENAKTDIEQTVREELSELMEKLSLEVDKHILHKKLFQPSLSCVLKTSISKEDSLVLTSCIFPNEECVLNHSILLSGDKAYGMSFMKNESAVKDCIGVDDLNLKFIKCVEVKNPLTSQTINLRQNDIEHKQIDEIWNGIIISLLIEKNANYFIGRTYNFKQVKKCIFFKICDGLQPLKRDHNLVIIPKDLSTSPIKTGDDLGIRYYDEEITTPHVRKEDDLRELKYSFLIKDTFKDKMDSLDREGNILFYDTDYQEI
jgi:hypothetical protein